MSLEPKTVTGPLDRGRPLFAGTDFPAHNAVGKALEAVVQKLDAGSVDSDTEGLQRFYDNVRERIALAKSDRSKQDIIRNLYDTFFNNAFPRMAERLGMVYTPVPVAISSCAAPMPPCAAISGKACPATGCKSLIPSPAPAPSLCG